MSLDFQSVLIPLFKYYKRRIVIDATNNEIGFRETTAGSLLTASVTQGTYTYGELAYEIKVAMQIAGDSVYTVRYDYTTRKYVLTSDGTGGGNDFELDVGAASSDLLPELGFAADQTGALAYTSTAVPAQTTLTFSENLRSPRVTRSVNREDLTLRSGRTESISLGGIDTYEFSVEYETPAVALAFYDMVLDSAEYGSTIEFYPDSTDTTNYVDVTFPDTTFSPREMTDEGLYRLYSWSIRLQQKIPNTGTLDMRSMLDRRPSS
jgi:hypothetical protein